MLSSNSLSHKHLGYGLNEQRPSIFSVLFCARKLSKVDITCFQIHNGTVIKISYNFSLCGFTNTSCNYHHVSLPVHMHSDEIGITVRIHMSQLPLALI